MICREGNYCADGMVFKGEVFGSFVVLKISE